MKIKIERRALASALADALPFAPQKSPLAILKYAKITTRGTRVKVEAFDSAASIRRYIDATECDGDGSFLADAASLCKYVAMVKDDVVELSLTDSALSVKHSAGRMRVHTMPASEYPAFEMPADGVAEFSVPASALCEAVTKGKNFVGTDDYRPMLKAIRAYIADGEFGYCATDTHKLIHGTENIGTPGTAEAQWYIEPCVFSALTKACACGGIALCKVSPTCVSYRVGSTVIQHVQSTGRYPDFRRVIPAEWAMECAADRDSFADSIRRAALSCEESRLVKLGISSSEICVSTENFAESKDSTDRIPCSSSGDVQLGMHADYLLTSLAACAPGEVVMRITDASRAVVFHQDSKPGTVVLQMPMSINQP